MPGQFAMDMLKLAGEFPTFSICDMAVPMPSLSSEVVYAEIIEGFPAGVDTPRNAPLRLRSSAGWSTNSLEGLQLPQDFPCNFPLLQDILIRSGLIAGAALHTNSPGSSIRFL